MFGIAMLNRKVIALAAVLALAAICAPFVFAAEQQSAEQRRLFVEGARLFSHATDGVMPWRGRPQSQGTQRVHLSAHHYKLLRLLRKDTSCSECQNAGWNPNSFAVFHNCTKF